MYILKEKYVYIKRKKWKLELKNLKHIEIFFSFFLNCENIPDRFTRLDRTGSPGSPY